MKTTLGDVSTVKNILKPWTKEPLTKCWDWCSPMLDGESLSKLYKCMGSYCSFYTNDTRAMVLHLEKHDACVGIFTCAYCVLVCNGINNLIDHIKKDHGQCRFQCGYCFYRSLDAANVLNHQQIYHAEDRGSDKSIIELAEHPDVPRVHYMSAALKGKVRQKILKCTVCHQQYMAISSFIEHVQTVHYGAAISCCWCLKTVKKDNVAAHFLTHYIGTYECLYCDYACNVKQMMQRHLSNVHSNKPLFCSKRREVMKLNQPNKKYLLDLRVEVSNEYVKTLDQDGLEGGTKKSINNNDKSPITEPILSGDDQKQGVGTDAAMPKILNVQGGIELSKEGAILAAKQTLPVGTADSPMPLPSAKVNGNRVMKRVGDSTVSGSNKRFKLIRSDNGTMLLKLSSGANITVAKPSTTAEQSVRPPSTFGKVPLRQYGKRPLIITSRTVQPIRKSTDSCKTNSSTNSSFDKPTSSKTFKSVIQRSFANSFQDGTVAKIVKIPDMTIFDKPIMASKLNVFGEREITVKQIGYHFQEFSDQIDRYYRFLCMRVNRKKVTPLEINVCGIMSCTERFENHDALLQHMRTYHHILSAEAPLPITCSHCLLKLSNINTYIYHLTVHSLNQYVCFVCCYKHFLLTTVVNHMNTQHGCTSVQLSFAHPVKKDILMDIITVMPGKISVEDKQKYIKETIEFGEKMVKKNFNLNKSYAWSNVVWSGITGTGPTHKKRHPKQAHYSLLYKCGLCGSNETSKISFQKHLIECPVRNNHNSYVCAHCNKTFKDWLKSPESIFEHLYFHGENLYGCGNCAYYHYLFENVAMHIKTVMHSSKCEINVLRESCEQWECNVCQLRSPLRQTIMEHMQNVHDLPGERFMCSLCKFRTFTNGESIQHFKDSHNEQGVVMIEMYHVKENENSSNNEDTDSDSSDDLQIIEKVIEAITISSSIDDDENAEERMADFDDYPNKSEQQVAELKRVGQGRKRLENVTLCAELREHNYSAIGFVENDQQVSVTKVKVEKVLETDNSTDATDTTATNANEATTMGCNEPSIDSPAAAADKDPPAEVGPVLTECVGEQSSENLCTSTSMESIMEQSLSPNTVMNVLSMERRASKRVAVKKDVTCRWSVCTKFGCLFCDDCFEHYKSLHMHSRCVHGLRSKNFLNEQKNESNAIGTFTGFRLCSIKRCFYCDYEDTYSALRSHCEQKHADKTFVCLDYWNPLKCGLCAYLNGSGHEKEFSNHFQQYHNTGTKLLSPFDHIDDSFMDWALKLGKKQNVASEGDGKIIRYICGVCTEQTEDELSMGFHVARHSLKYDCPQCEASFQTLKVLYDHLTVIHRKEDYAVPSAVPTIPDQTLLEVNVCFINGFILTKREAQYTSHGSIQLLEEGYQKYYAQQVSELEAHKALLLMPVLTSAEEEENITCKSFIQNQNKFLVIKITPVEVNDLEENE